MTFEEKIQQINEQHQQAMEEAVIEEGARLRETGLSEEEVANIVLIKIAKIAKEM